MSRVPPWVRSSTDPTTAEVEGVHVPLDPALTASVRSATAPSASEVTRLRARLPTAQRGWSPLWVGAPALVAVLLLTARWVVPTTALDAGSHPQGLFAVTVENPREVVAGVWVSGRGTADVHDGVVGLDGILRVVVSSPVELAVGGARFTTADAEVHVAGDALAVVRGSLRAADGAFLVPGDRYTPAGPIVTTQVAPVPTEVPDLAPRRVPLVAHAPVTLVVDDATDAVVEVEAAEPPVGPSAPSAAVAAWKELLDARDGGLAGDRLVRALEGYRGQFPASPFREEATDLLALAQVQTLPAARALAGLEQRLGEVGSGRPLELHAAAAFLARESLRDCARARPHDTYVSERGSERQRSTARAFLGLCAVREGRMDDARVLLVGVDGAGLDPELAVAVARARLELEGGDVP